MHDPLIWNRSGRNIPGYFWFEPYLYGPCSFEVYSLLDDLCARRLMVQLPHPVEWWPEHCLTPHERRVLRLVGQGLRNKKIAKALGISVYTVKNHVHSLFQKLGAKRRYELSQSLAVDTKPLRRHSRNAS